MYSYTTAGRPAAGRRDWLHQIAAATNKKQKSFVILFGFKGKNKYFVIFSRIRIFQKWKMKNGIPHFQKWKMKNEMIAPGFFQKWKIQKIKKSIFESIQKSMIEVQNSMFERFTPSMIDFWKLQRLIFEGVKDWFFELLIFSFLKNAPFIFIFK